MIIGMAGHVDHGKSTLVTALTGRPMDRLAEERQRGITIDLNFAPLDLAPGVTAGIIDVPGHEDFVRTMVAGASGIDVALLVIAADDGIMPQTREHLLVLEQLRVPAGVAVITKADAVDPEWLALVHSDVTEWLSHSSLPFGELLVASSATGRGIRELRTRLARLASTVPSRDANDIFRLAIDRVFSLTGTGTVVTGTTTSGSIGTGSLARLLPSGLEVRVRSIETHGTALERSTPGMRTAIALGGAEREQISRGDVLVLAAGPWEATTRLDAEVALSREAGTPLTDRTRVRVHLGTSEVMARVRTDTPLEPGGIAVVRLNLEMPVVARGDDRLVLRSYSPVSVIGGGWVVDPLPESRRRTTEGLGSPDPATRLDALVARRRHGVELRLLPVLLGLPPAACASLVRRSTSMLVAGALVVRRELVERLAENLVHEVEAFHRREPLETGISVETLRHTLGVPEAVAAAALAAASSRLVIRSGTAALAGFRPVTRVSDADRGRLVAMVREAGLTAPSAVELADRLGIPEAQLGLQQAVGTGEVIQVEPGRFLAIEALEGFTKLLREVGSTGEITPAAVRDRSGLSRKYLIPLLEWADRNGITHREGEGRRLRTPPAGVRHGA